MNDQGGAGRARELILVRHAHAGDPGAWGGDDARRPLTEKGRRQAKRLGSFIRATGLKPDALVSSPLTRALETAELLAQPLRLAVLVDERLGGPLGIDRLERILSELDADRPVLVGHDPDFSALVATLCGATRIPMKKGALARLDVDRPLQEGGGVLRWLLPPSAMAMTTAADADHA